MKIKVDMENKKAEAEAEIEKLVEKGMDNHEKNWKEKFSLKHNAKKEIMELKHEQKMEKDKANKTKRGIIDKIIEGRIKEKELELEEIRRKEEERIANKKRKTLLGIVGVILGLILSIVGAVLVSNLENQDNPLYFILLIGIMILIVSIGCLADNPNEKEEIKKKK